MANANEPLIVLSNRGPLRFRKGEWVRSSGGLVTALDPMLRERGGSWVCAEEPGEHDRDRPDLGYDVVPVALSQRRQRRFYNGFSNAVLWPMLHGFPPTTRVGTAPWDDYVGANEEFVDQVFRHGRGGEMIWVHDYHLMLAPRMIRMRLPRARIGWFCHIPWPSSDHFQILPWRRYLLEGLLGADLVAFHTDHYADRFLECVERFVPGATVSSDRTITHRHGTVTVEAVPIGIPTEDYQQLSEDPDVQAMALELRTAVLGRRIILGVDRLDYTKGIHERLLAYDRLLTQSPELRDWCVLVQVMVPSRTEVGAYSQLKDEIDQLVGRINGRHGHTGRVPIHYLYRNLDRQTLFAHYVAADVALITPLRDGMNLVAQEYVWSRTREDGVLILSEFAGAAELLPDALIVNPYDVEQVSRAVRQALTMEPVDMQRRMKNMRAVVAELDVHVWASRFLGDLARVKRSDPMAPAHNGAPPAPPA